MAKPRDQRPHLPQAWLRDRLQLIRLGHRFRARLPPPPSDSQFLGGGNWSQAPSWGPALGGPRDTLGEPLSSGQVARRAV